MFIEQLGIGINFPNQQVVSKTGETNKLEKEVNQNGYEVQTFDTLSDDGNTNTLALDGSKTERTARGGKTPRGSVVASQEFYCDWWNKFVNKCGSDLAARKSFTMNGVLNGLGKFLS